MDTCTNPNLSLSFFACVLLPEHGGPKSTITRGADDSEAIRVAFCHRYLSRLKKKINSRIFWDPKRGSWLAQACAETLLGDLICSLQRIFYADIMVRVLLSTGRLRRTTIYSPLPRSAETHSYFEFPERYHSCPVLAAGRTVRSITASTRLSIGCTMNGMTPSPTAVGMDLVRV